MKVLIILALVAAVLVLISLIRLGVQVIYVPSGLTVKVKVGPVRVTVLPRRKKRPKQERKEKEKEKGQPERSGGDVLGQIRRALPLIAEAAGRLRRKVQLDRIYLDVTAAAPDPASAALAFGGVNAAIGMIWPLVEQNFNVVDRRIRTQVDFEASHPAASLDAAATLTIGQALALAVWLAPTLPQITGAEHQKKKRTDSVQKEAV